LIEATSNRLNNRESENARLVKKVSQLERDQGIIYKEVCERYI